jgi:hypothetical protein
MTVIPFWLCRICFGDSVAWLIIDKYVHGYVFLIRVFDRRLPGDRTEVRYVGDGRLSQGHVACYLTVLTSFIAA